MSRVRVSTKTVLAVIFAVLCVCGLIFSIEFYEEKEQTKWSLEAYRNPYLAAQQFLSRSGIEVVDADSLIKLDTLEGVSTILITDANQVVSPRQLDEVLKWLEQGGNVIVTANSLSDSDDLLLKEFDVVVARREYDLEEDLDFESISDRLREYNRQIDEGKTKEEIAETFEQDTSLTVVEFDDDIGNLEIAFDSFRILTHPYVDGEDYDTSKAIPNSWSSSEHGIHLMQFDVGEGLLTIISDSSIWTSYRIDQHDHAFLLWVLSSRDGNFAILRPVLQDSLWDLAVQHASELLIAVGLLLAIWVWHLGHRFGRILPRNTDASRALGEHFSSITHYLWHRKRSDDLIAPLRQRVLRRASLKLAEFARADQSRQMDLISKRCSINVISIERAFQDTEFNEISFVHTVKLLRHIEQSL